MPNVFRLLLLVIMLVMPAGWARAQEDADRPPNFIIIMTDDMGYAGLSCTGLDRFKTPHLDALAKAGLCFTDFHSNGTVCSPTRAALLTGRYQQRTGVDGVVNADPKHPDYRQFLKPGELTFAELLKTCGYSSAIMGKWHVGYDVKHNPTHHGFDVFRGFVSGNIDYISHYDRMETFDWWHDRELTKEKGYSTHLINKYAVEFIEANKDKPFCLYVAHEAIHNPNQGPNDPAIRGPEKRPKKELQPTLDAVREMTLAMDDGVGQIVAKLHELGLEENTLVWFFSDNGGTGENKSTGPDLRGMKGSVWEGGHRVPAIVSWPGRIKPGTTTDATVLTMDVMPTLGSLSGAEVPASYKPDGVDLSKLLLKDKPLAERPLFWKFKSKLAMREGPWKLVVNERGLDGPGLFNLSDDLAEANNLAEKQPERVAKMLAAIKAWEQDVSED